MVEYGIHESIVPLLKLLDNKSTSQKDSLFKYPVSQLQCMN